MEVLETSNADADGNALLSDRRTIRQSIDEEEGEEEDTVGV